MTIRVALDAATDAGGARPEMDLLLGLEEAAEVAGIPLGGIGIVLGEPRAVVRHVAGVETGVKVRRAHHPQKISLNLAWHHTYIETENYIIHRRQEPTYMTRGGLLAYKVNFRLVPVCVSHIVCSY